jgi:hypothetical protein
MQKILRSIRKKGNLRRLSVLCLALIVLELFCPALCDEPAFAAELGAAKSSQATISIDDSGKSPDRRSDVFMTGCDHQGSGDHEKSVCNDECLCHSTAIPSSVGITIKEESVLQGERIAFRYGEPLFNSLPPPFQPPKNS